MLASSKTKYVILGNGHIHQNINMTNIGGENMPATLIKPLRKEVGMPSIKGTGD